MNVNTSSIVKFYSSFRKLGNLLKMSPDNRVELISQNLDLKKYSHGLIFVNEQFGLIQAPQEEFENAFGINNRK